MFETCAGTGSILAGASPEIVENMEKWGLNLGLCFQLMDDLIDITGDTVTLGKPAGSDIVQGKKDPDCYPCPTVWKRDVCF